MQCTGFVTVNMYLLFTALSDHQELKKYVLLQDMYIIITSLNFHKSLTFTLSSSLTYGSCKVIYFSRCV